MTIKILFIAYYFEPYKGVGSKRISYWAKNIKRVSNAIVKCDVITATPQVDSFEHIDSVIYLEDTNAGTLRKFIRFDKGASWLNDLNKYIDANVGKLDYDYVIMTGDPFLHFFSVKKFKKLGIKSILDFRDPFANNPRNPLKGSAIGLIKRSILRKIENHFLKSADYIIAVNQYCVPLFENYQSYANKIEVIDNGYDEQAIDRQKLNIDIRSTTTSTLGFTYAGKLYADRNPSEFFKCLRKFKDMKFVHIGEPSEYLPECSNQIYSIGPLAYDQTLEALAKFDVCMIFTSGHNFESTTKIFDYIALNKIIMVVTNGEVNTGQINDITKHYPRVFWSRNNSHDIEKTLNNIKNFHVNIAEPQFDSYQFSREYGLNKLVRLLNDKKCISI